MPRFSRRLVQLALGAFLGMLVPGCDDGVQPPSNPFVALDQTPLPATGQGLYSDTACGGGGCAGDSVQVAAENFVLAKAAALTDVTIWGGYFPNDDPVATDKFTVVLHADAGGSPGTALHAEALFPVRTPAGASFAGVAMYRYAFDFQSPPHLAAGTYWVEIYNNTTGNTSNFTWVRGMLDATDGVAGASISATAPGSTWSALTSFDLAMRIDAR